MDRSRASAISAAASLCCRGLLIAAAVTFSVLGAHRRRSVELAVGAPHNWQNQPAALGQQAGIFKKHGLVPRSSLPPKGVRRPCRRLIAGSVEILNMARTYGATGAFAKGVLVRVIGNATTGAHDLYRYVRAHFPSAR